MLKIRLSRTGKNVQPNFRIVLQEHSAAVKGKYKELLGYYRPATPGKDFSVNQERVEYWIKNGAKPSDAVAALLKKHGVSGMEKYLSPRDKKRRKKGEQPEEQAAPAQAQAAPQPAAAEPAAAEPAAAEPAAAEPAAAEPAAAEPAAAEPAAAEEPPKEA